ncbi:hypothetical protein LI014_02145 [Clostridium perfringens]|uniref:hypothetical protein n=1 Tax=Clostridium perfringens TaxID=1502 RepID=UPI002246084D|nr:hypothetical protein [Clostridium perfringens]MCX0396186.1 hypothetical protein [Clostridium perfringens]
MNKLKLTRNILTSALLIVIGVIAGMLISNHMKSVKANTKPTVAIQQEQSNNQPVRLVKVLTESTEDIKLDKGDVYREFSNSAWVIENCKNDTYELCIPELGDWTYVLHNKSDFDKLVKTYLINVNE